MSDLGECAIQTYNGGIMFVSYLISVVGAQTTLELLSRRTHIKGAYNWFLLTSAAFVMGAVSIWSMHFIGNNSMTLYINGGHYQLSYSAGYTFASLVVSIVCMFIAFVFVGITEDARLIRIIPSGIFAGLGVVCMHYMGQFAITYFKVFYRLPYLGGAIVIACVAVTVALTIFFKLREKWMNQWYKRLGCAMLMALAVCGMHYTALVGTDFYLPDFNNGNTIPLPKLKTAALIGIIAAIIVIACIVLLYISIKTGMKNLPLYMKNTNKRLILDAVIFDPIGRVLVNVDGTLPMTEIVHNLELNETKQEFNAHHPLFLRLYETAIQKASARFGFEKRPSGLSATSTLEAYDLIENQYLEGCRELKDELRFSHFSDLGILSDIVVTTDTIAKSSSVFSVKKKNSARCKKNNNKGRPLNEIELTFRQVNQGQMTDEEEQSPSKKKFPKNWRNHQKKSEDEETAIESFSTVGKRSSGGTTVVHHEQRSSSEETNGGDNKSVNDRLSVEDSDGEDKHIFMVRKLVSEKDVDRLLSQGYRFAETLFISKTMATKLKIPTDHMRNHFTDMQQMADSLCALTQHDWMPSTVEPAPNPTIFTASPKQNVYMGAFVLIDETKDMTNTQILVEKTRRFSFPTVQIKSELVPLPCLDRKQTEFLFHLQGRSLYDFAHLKQTFAQLEEKSLFEKLPDDSFLQSIEMAAQKLLDMTSYSKALYQSSKLHATVLDLPPFALTSGPCQLILFKSFVTTQGAITAINHTFSESMKCIPLQLYRPLCGFITDQAASIYQNSTQARTLPTYLLQQQMYRQQTSNSYSTTATTIATAEDKAAIPMDTFKERVVEETPSSDGSFSLPPPPRAKKNRFKLTNAILNNSPFDMLSPLQDGTVKNARNLHTLQAAPLTVLATQDRFWWINPIVEETIHSGV